MIRGKRSGEERPEDFNETTYEKSAYCHDTQSFTGIAPAQYAPISILILLANLQSLEIAPGAALALRFAHRQQHLLQRPQILYLLNPIRRQIKQPGKNAFVQAS